MRRKDQERIYKNIEKKIAKKSPLARGYIINERIRIDVEEATKLEERREALYMKILQIVLEKMRKNYLAFWQRHHENVKEIGGNAEILRRYYRKTTLI